ncbi:hypothetical protein [Chromobacterium subtsugae]|uniref:hypothetical protein n=1 Tax=Chromobacterium subtsugae TaxID=251747 RepID=UPI00069979D6|nr:hypothetical protein [Chromobacterium subtsugae]
MQHLHDIPDTGAAIAAVNEANAAGDLNLGEQPTSHINGVHVYEMNDCDWVVARSEQEAQAYYCDLNGEDDPPRALTAEELDRLGFFVDAEQPDGHSITFRERLQQLVDNNEQIPDLFATTEY